MQPSDKKHTKALRLLESARGFIVPDTTLFEFHAVLRGRGRSNQAIKQVILALAEVLDAKGADTAKTFDPLLIVSQCDLESKYGLTFFDSLIAASALRSDGVVISDDKAFDNVPGLERVPLG